MRNNAKVNLDDVEKFKNAVSSAKDFRDFKKCSDCLIEFRKEIEHKEKSLEEAKSELKESKSLVISKIENLERAISELIKRRDVLHRELRDIKAQIAVTQSHLVETDDEGKTYNVPNPEYETLCAQKDELESDIEAVNSELLPKQQRADRAKRLKNEISAQEDTIRLANQILTDKIKDCLKLSAEIDEINSLNLLLCNTAYNKLVKIGQVIQEYLSVAMKFESPNAATSTDEPSQDETGGTSSSSNDFLKNDNKSSDDEAATRDKEHLDDNGKVFRIGNDLIKNATFQVNGYTYKTDNEGRTISASGKLSLNPLGQKNRNMPDSINDIGKSYELETDDRGHLIGHQFNGSDRMENLVPQDQNINRGAFRKHEEDLAAKVGEGCTVTVDVMPLYDKESRRPNGIFYFCCVDGVSRMIYFPNKSEDM